MVAYIAKNFRSLTLASGVPSLATLDPALSSLATASGISSPAAVTLDTSGGDNPGVTLVSCAPASAPGPGGSPKTANQCGGGDPTGWMVRKADGTLVRVDQSQGYGNNGPRGGTGGGNRNGQGGPADDNRHGTGNNSGGSARGNQRTGTRTLSGPRNG